MKKEATKKIFYFYTYICDTQPEQKLISIQFIHGIATAARLDFDTVVKLI